MPGSSLGGISLGESPVLLYNSQYVPLTCHIASTYPGPIHVSDSLPLRSKMMDDKVIRFSWADEQQE